MDKTTDERKRFERPSQLLSAGTRERISRVFRLGILFSLLLFVAFPVYWTFVNSFRAGGSIFQTTPNLVPSDISFEFYEQLIFETNFPTYFVNSVVVAAGATLLATVLATIGGYGLARSKMKSKRNVARGVIFTYMFPALLLGIPLYTIFFRLGLLNSYFALILAHTAVTLPFGLWIMWQYFQTIPLSYEESAWINGASKARTFKDVILPMAWPGIIAVGIFAFAASWNDFTFAVILMTDNASFTLPVGVNQFIEETQVHWGLVLSAAVLIMIPAFVLIFFLQKHLLRGVGSMS